MASALRRRGVGARERMPVEVVRIVDWDVRRVVSEVEVGVGMAMGEWEDWKRDVGGEMVEGPPGMRRRSNWVDAAVSMERVTGICTPAESEHNPSPLSLIYWISTSIACSSISSGASSLRRFSFRNMDNRSMGARSSS